MGEIKRLTKKEEQAIIDKYIIDGGFIDNGSSRAVFKGSAGEVVKIAMDDEGRVQNRNEINFYIKHKDTGYFANISAYGEFVVIMEELSVHSIGLYQNFYEYYENYDSSELLEDFFENFFYEYIIDDGLDDEREEMEWQYKRVYDMFEFMEGILSNSTADNSQIGEDREGNLKWYDYGFDTKYKVGSQVGDVSSYIFSKTGKITSSRLREELLSDGIIWEYLTPIEDMVGRER